MEWSSKWSSVRHSLPSSIPNYCHHSNACAFLQMLIKSVGHPSRCTDLYWESRTPLKPYLSLLPQAEGKLTSGVMFLKSVPTIHKFPQPLTSCREFSLDFSLPFNMGFTSIPTGAVGKHSVTDPKFSATTTIKSCGVGLVTLFQLFSLSHSHRLPKEETFLISHLQKTWRHVCGAPSAPLKLSENTSESSGNIQSWQLLNQSSPHWASKFILC